MNFRCGPPNNPVPSIIEKNALREFVLEISQDRMVLVDEAYFEFVEDPDYATMMDLVRDGHQNIIVARTASKIHALAGLRIASRSVPNSSFTGCDPGHQPLPAQVQYIRCK